MQLGMPEPHDLYIIFWECETVERYSNEGEKYRLHGRLQMCLNELVQERV